MGAELRETGARGAREVSFFSINVGRGRTEKRVQILLVDFSLDR